jgi:hypothetical protein
MDGAKERWIRQAAREIPILVLGILIAFALQAWWDRAREASETRRAVLALQSELRLNEIDLQAYISRHQRIGQASYQMRSLLQPGDASVAVPDSLLIAVLIAPTFDPATGALESLQRIGGASNALAESMAEWSALVADAAGEEIRTRAFADERLSPYLSRGIDLPDPELAIPWIFERLESPIVGETTLESTSELRFLIGTRIKLANLCEMELTEVLAATRALLDVVEAELS